ncbi:putative ribonuclease H-like domain-containing protein [Tanacetum coccineum]|uniref:Ribonuclease H-like domain-containing protein n=1 Tax=Tanacetum coccineum TaxID=301880 RepID=A0ABQ5FI29_9ASTR
MGFTVYQIDVKSAFLYGTIEEEVYVHQPPGFVDPAHQNKVYKVIKALYGLHQAPRAWYETLFSFLMENGFMRVKKQPDGIFISQDKYVANILKKFDFLSIRTSTTPIESNKPLVKGEDGVDVDVHIYRSMIGSLMYLTTSREDIMFAVFACARFQVTLKASHLNAVKRIFRYLKHQPKLGLWYPRDSSFKLEAFSDSDYGGASLNRKSTIGGCQFLGRRLISWKCKKQTIMANSTIEAEYVAAANCCRQVLWIQNQMMDYGFNFMNTKIHIDNDSTISVIKNLVAHSRTKHIKIQFHFIRDCYEKRLIEVIKIHTDHNVADLLTKGFDVTRFNFLVVSIEGRQDDLLYSLESLERDIDGTEELLLPDLFILWLTKVSTDIAKYITAKVAGRPVNISEASIRRDLLFDDADGIDSFHNQAIFDVWRFLFHTMNHCISSKSTYWDQIPTNIATAVICWATNQVYNFSKLIFDGMMRHLDAKKKFVMYPRFILVFLTNQLKNVPVPLDHFPINALTTKVFSFMVKKGKKNSGNVTPLFPSMLAQPTEDEGAVSERPSETQPTPSPTHPSEDQSKPQPDPFLRPSSSNPIPDFHSREKGGGGVWWELMEIKQAYRRWPDCYQPSLDWIKSLLMKKRLARKKKMESVSKHGRKTFKYVPTMHKDPAFDDLDDAMDYMETEDAQSILTLKPLPKIDPKDKGKKVLKEKAESDAESEGVNEAEKKFKMLANDEEIARKVQEEWEAKEEKKKLAEEEATKAAFTNEYPIINWEIKFYDYGHFGRELIYYKVFRADGSSRIMFESKEDDELWKNQEEWKLHSWIFYENCKVHVLRLANGTEINMIVERRYPLTKNTLERMMDLRLTAVSDDDTVFDLLRFIEQQIDEFGGQDGKGKLKENQGCRVDTDQVHQNGDLKNRSVWIHPPGLQDVYTKET